MKGKMHPSGRSFDEIYVYVQNQKIENFLSVFPTKVLADENLSFIIWI
jgi:hypothetical protein